jgi:hypothetical protein
VPTSALARYFPAGYVRLAADPGSERRLAASISPGDAADLAAAGAHAAGGLRGRAIDEGRTARTENALRRAHSGRLAIFGAMTTRWESVVELPAWTSEMAIAAGDAGIEVTPDDGFTAEPTTVAMVVEAENPDRARRRVRDMLEDCGVRVGIAAFRHPSRAS